MQIDHELSDFYTIRFKRVIVPAREDGETTVSPLMPWYLPRQGVLECGKKMTWLDGAKIVCSEPMKHPGVCLGVGPAGDKKAFSRG